MSKSRFENALLRLFLQAEAEGRRDTAEHLMRALEALYAGPDTGAATPPVRDEQGAAAKRRPPSRAPEEPSRQNGAVARGGRPKD
jgi:hypothetical protein